MEDSTAIQRLANMVQENEERFEENKKEIRNGNDVKFYNNWNRDILNENTVFQHAIESLKNNRSYGKAS